MKTRCPLVVVAMFAAASTVHAAGPGASESGNPSSARWQIHSVVYGMTSDGKVISRSEHAILLDAEYGPPKPSAVAHTTRL